MVSMIDAATELAERGWPVFPLHTPTSTGPKKSDGRASCSCRRPDCENQGKHPRLAHGLHDATTDPDAVANWWTSWPDANIGIRTGIAFDVLDLDGDDALDALDAAGPGEPAIDGPMAVTGNGVHIYLATTGAGNRAGFLGHVDWRGAGGYVVAPPSLHHLGHRYTWHHGPGTTLHPAPTWLADLVTRRNSAPPIHRGAPGVPAGAGGSRYGLRALEGELGRLASAGEGTRNNTLVQAAYRAGQLVGGGELEPVHAVAELLTVAQRIGLSDHEAQATIASGIQSGARQPRRAA